MALVKFKAHGKTVSFHTSARRSTKRRGKVPAHLKPFLFKPGKGKAKAKAKTGRRRSAWPKGKVPKHLKKYLFR